MRARSIVEERRMLIVTATLLGRPETFDRLRTEAIAHSTRSRAEDGCSSHNVHVDCEDPMRLFFFERWTDRDALKAHSKNAGTAAFLAVLSELGVNAERPSVFTIAEPPPA